MSCWHVVGSPSFITPACTQPRFAAQQCYLTVCEFPRMHLNRQAANKGSISLYRASLHQTFPFESVMLSRSMRIFKDTPSQTGRNQRIHQLISRHLAPRRPLLLSHVIAERLDFLRCTLIEMSHAKGPPAYINPACTQPKFAAQPGFCSVRIFLDTFLCIGYMQWVQNHISGQPAPSRPLLLTMFSQSMPMFQGETLYT